MKSLIFGLVAGLMFLSTGTYNSYADMRGSIGDTGDGMHEGCMPMMEGMKHRGYGMMRPELRMWDRLRNLSLDEKQKEVIKEIRSKAEKDTIRKRADIKVAGVELRDILHKDPVDMKAAEAKLKQLESLRTDLKLAHIKTREEIKAQLTPDQRKKLIEDFGKQKRWERGGKGMHKHEEGRG